MINNELSNETTVSEIKVRKRDGVTLQNYDIFKIKKAVVRAWNDSGHPLDEKSLNKVIKYVFEATRNDVIDVETVQNVVEVSLMRHGLFEVAKSYILYRHKRSEARQARKAVPDLKAISDYIHAGKYAKYIPGLSRREIYEETVARTEGMHVRKFPNLEKEIKLAFDLVRNKRLLPSMRSMQFGGPAIEANNARIFNCSFSFIDRPRAFSEALYLLLSGCGVGYSVQYDHVDKLPIIPYIDGKKVRHHVVEDTIEGWADALEALIQSYLDGVYLEVSFHKIRLAGTPLITSGGRAPGHLKLKDPLEKIRGVLNAVQGRKLRPIECHRIMCHAADAVLSGGIRRSAMICLFSLDDSEMMNCKTGNWWQNDPWFSNANNSVVLKRDEVKKKQFKRIFQMTRQWGEPGFYFTHDYDYGTNPCGEIGLNPKLVIDESVKAVLKSKGIDSETGAVHTGWAFCNLCEINAAKLTSYEEFQEVAKAATLIGTIQATYTKLPYLGWVSEHVAEREALLGIGLTGMLDAPHISCNPEYQSKIANEIKEWNKEYSTLLGINPAARTTCIKPSGTTSLELGCVGSGHHAHHARRYIRRVTADELEHIFQAFKAVNPHMCVRKPDGKYVIEFPVEAPQGAMIKDDIGAIEFLEMVKSTQQNWVMSGTANESISPGLTHNVSNTVNVRTEEWDKVSEYLWENRNHFTGVSLLAATGDKDYAFAPMEAVVTEADEARWNAIISGYKPVDYTGIIEMTDDTTLNAEMACVGGACALV